MAPYRQLLFRSNSLAPHFAQSASCRPTLALESICLVGWQYESRGLALLARCGDSHKQGELTADACLMKGRQCWAINRFGSNHRLISSRSARVRVPPQTRRATRERM